jgi:hypothetical protein
VKTGLILGDPHEGAVRLGLRLQRKSASASVDYHRRIVLPSDDLGNLLRSNCVECGYYRQAQLRMAVAWGSIWAPTQAMSLGLYSRITGFDQTTGQPDNGTDLATAQAYVAANGLGDLGIQWEELVAPVALPDLDPATLDWATEEFGSVGLHLALPLAWQDDPSWAMPAGGVDSPGGKPGGWGHHYVPSGKYDPRRREVISWGFECPLTPETMAAYCVSASAGLSRSWMEDTGRSPLGLAFNDVMALAQSA